MIIKKRKVLVINTHFVDKEQHEVLIANTRLPIIIDRTIEHAFEVKEIE